MEAGRKEVWVRSLRLGAVRGSDSQLSQTGKLQRSHQLEESGQGWHWVSSAPQLQNSRGGHGVGASQRNFCLGRQGSRAKCSLGQEELSFRGRPGLAEQMSGQRETAKPRVGDT